MVWSSNNMTTLIRARSLIPGWVWQSFEICGWARQAPDRALAASPFFRASFGAAPRLGVASWCRRRDHTLKARDG